MAADVPQNAVVEVGAKVPEPVQKKLKPPNQSTHVFLDRCIAGSWHLSNTLTREVKTLPSGPTTTWELHFDEAGVDGVAVQM